MESEQQNEKRTATAFLPSILWFIFSGTAMLSAFVLPIHILAMQTGKLMNFNNAPLRIYFFILIFSALYHGLYRVKTIIFDLGLEEKIGKAAALIISIIFIFYTLAAAWLIFLS